MTVYSRLMVAVSSDDRVRNLVTRWPTTQLLVERFVAGESADDALGAVAGLAADGILATVDRLGESVSDPAEARGNTEAYCYLIGLAAQQGLAAGLDVSVKLSALGLALPAAGDRAAYDNAASVCERAAAVGATVTLDMEGYTTTEATLVVHEQLRQDFPDVGVAVQAALRRSESDCRALAASGARVRLCKGAYLVPSMVGYGHRDEVRASYARCLGILMVGTAYPMVATHDPDLVDLAGRLATHLGRFPATPSPPHASALHASALPAPALPAPASQTVGASPVGVPAGRAERTAGTERGSGSGSGGTVLVAAPRPAATDRAAGSARSFEYQMLLGVRPSEQHRLVAGGAKVRVYVPYGPSWYPYLTRRLAERPGNLALFLRAVADRH